MGTETTLGRFVAPGELPAVLTWEDGRFRAGGEDVPASRVAAWDDADYVEWAGPDTRAWFARERAAGRTQPIESAEDDGFDGHELPQPLVHVLWFGAAILAWLPLSLVTGVPATVVTSLVLAGANVSGQVALALAAIFITAPLILLLLRTLVRALGLRYRLPRWLWLAPFVAAWLGRSALGWGPLDANTLLYIAADYVVVPLAGAVGIAWALRDVEKAGGRRRMRRTYPDRGRERRGPLWLVFAGVFAMFFGCGWFVLAFGASMTDASTPSDVAKALTPWAPVATFALLFAPVAMIAGAITAWQQRGR